MLDNLADRGVAALMRQVLDEIIAAEGPVHVDRLAKIAATRFGMAKLREIRRTQIQKLVPTGVLRDSGVGQFAWPLQIDPETWRSYRPTRPASIKDRPIEFIAPEEIRNVVFDIVGQAYQVEVAELIRLTRTVFGFSRSGANVQAYVGSVIDQMVENGSLRWDNEHIMLGSEAGPTAVGPSQLSAILEAQA